MSTYEALSLMIAFGVLVVMVIGTKNSHPPPKAVVTIFFSRAPAFSRSHSSTFIIPLETNGFVSPSTRCLLPAIHER